MRARARSKMLNHLLEVKESRQYLEALTARNEGITLAIIRKNLHYATCKEAELLTQLNKGEV